MCTVSGSAAVVTIKPCGDLDAATAPTFRKAVAAAIASPDVQAVDLDLSALTFVDSSGLREFIDVSRMAVAHDVELALSQATPHVRNTFVLVGLEQLLRPDDERNVV